MKRDEGVTERRGTARGRSRVRHASVRAARGLVLLLLAAFTAGCDEAFDPFVEGGPEAFALTGFLDARADTQFVRLQDLTSRELTLQPDDVTFTSTLLPSGASRTWQDSLVTLDDGSLGLLFFDVFRPETNAVYRLRAEGMNGEQQTVDVLMPSRPELLPSTPSVIGSLVSQRLFLESAVLPRAVEVVYTARQPGEPPLEVIVPQQAEPVSSAVGFDILVRLSNDAGRVRGRLGAGAGESVELLGLRLRYDIVDPNRVDVGSGLGVIGVAASFENPWRLPTETVEALGFEDRQTGR